MRYREQQVHEGYILTGSYSYLKEHVLQFPFLSFAEFTKKMDRYSSLRAQEMYGENRKFKLWNLVINPFAMFARMYFNKLGFLDGTAGLVLSLLYGYYYTLIKYVKLWEKYQEKD
mgnify:CR=1 FL=1